MNTTISRAGRDILLHEMSLRDGMHAKKEQIDVTQMVRIAKALDAANVPLIQVTHGAGLGGNSLQHGFALAANEEYISAVAQEMSQAVVSVLLIPGIGTTAELDSAYRAGARSVHVATHCTEADTSPTHIGRARELGMDASGFLMMAHLNDAKGIVEQARLMERYGAQTIYVTDSAGYLLPDDVTERIRALRDALDSDTEIGFHGHHNLGMAVANSMTAVCAGATRIDASAAGMGAGAGNCPTEVFAAVCERLSIRTGVDLFALMDVAEDIIVPILDTPIRVDRAALTLGYAGVYSTFLHKAAASARKHSISTRDLLVELGRRKMIGGQEDMIDDTAMDMARNTK